MEIRCDFLEDVTFGLSALQDEEVMNDIQPGRDGRESFL